MTELRALPSTRLLVTLTCDGFRRKELNQLQHTKGANTGPAATGTSVWTGVLLIDLLRHSNVLPDEADIQPKHAHIVADGLDEPAKGVYGTSFSAIDALDPRAQLLVAWAQNDEPLTLRLIGGRSIKWLGRIALSSHSSTSRYHLEDNLLPAGLVSIAEWNGGKYFDRAECDTTRYASTSSSSTRSSRDRNKTSGSHSSKDQQRK